MKQSILESVLGVPNLDTPEALAAAHRTLSGDSLTPGELGVEILRVSACTTLDDEVRYQGLCDIKNIISGEQVSASTLIDWHGYSMLIDDYGYRADGTATALMIGALSAVSSRSFVRLAEEEYGANKAIIVDSLGGRDKVRHGTFLQADGLHLPLADGSVDFVHTNNLLHHLQPEGSTSPSGRVRRLFGEINRVLVPGGQVCMIEQPIQMLHSAEELNNMDQERIEGIIERMVGRFERWVYRPEFEVTAITNPRIQLKHNPDSGQYTLSRDYLFDPERDFTFDDNGEVTMSYATIAAYIRKRGQKSRPPFVMPPGPVSDQAGGV